MAGIEVNLTYRWFLGLGLGDKVPDPSTLSQNRRRRFTGTSIYQDIFDEIVLQAMAGMADFLAAWSHRRRWQRIEMAGVLLASAAPVFRLPEKCRSWSTVWGS